MLVRSHCVTSYGLSKEIAVARLKSILIRLTWNFHSVSAMSRPVVYTLQTRLTLLFRVVIDPPFWSFFAVGASKPDLSPKVLNSILTMVDSYCAFVLSLHGPKFAVVLGPNCCTLVFFCGVFHVFWPIFRFLTKIEIVPSRVQRVMGLVAQNFFPNSRKRGLRFHQFLWSGSKWFEKSCSPPLP